MKISIFSSRSAYLALSTLGVLMFVFAIALIVLYVFKPAPAVLPTYFSYENISFRSLPRAKLTEPFVGNELFSWDEQVGALATEEKISDAETARLYAYLATAEHDMVMLATQAGATAVAVSPVVKGVVCEFLPQSCTRLVASNDPYSVALAELVLAKVRERKVSGDAGVHTYPFATTYAQYWDNAKKYPGMEVGSWKPWHVRDVQSFRESEPPVPDGIEGVAQMRKLDAMRADVSADEQARSFAYTLERRGGAGVLDLMKNLSELQRSNVFDIVRITHERMLLAQAVADALIVAYDNKYTYWYPRPEMMTSPGTVSAPTSTTPGFPSAGVTLAAAGTTLISEWYPSQRHDLEERLRSLQDTYLRSGGYRPLEVDAGVRIGTRVANSILAE